jgi:two-component system phosphate regulon sensor histidine kinase PhoR
MSFSYMHKRTSRFIVILSLSVVLPLISYLIFQLFSIRQSEKIITGVYEEQLKSVLFSVNQYAYDYMSKLIDKIEATDSIPENTVSLLGQEIRKIGFGFDFTHQLHSGQAGSDKNFSYPEITSSSSNFPIEQLDLFLDNNRTKTKQLIAYSEIGYRKIEPLDVMTIDGTTYQVIQTILTIKGQKYLYTTLINPLTFGQEVLSPRMQQIADQKLILFFQRNDASSEILYTTGELTNDIKVTSKVWLFPSYLLGVSPKILTVQDLIKEQRNTSLILILVLFVTMGTGVFLIVKNIHREAQLNQAKSDFVSSVSHELRTPLALIKMFAETMMLGRAKNEEKKKEYLEIIFKETNRLTNIVNRILNFSRIEANRKVYHKEQVDLTDLLKEIGRDYSYHLEQHGFTFEVNLDNREYKITADREAIYEAVIIVVDNAMKYSDETKHISLSIASASESTGIVIEDQGIGIAPEKLEQIFDRFFRVSDNDRYVAQGAGLGLSILRHIMQAHDGDVKVESKLGKGSKFTLYFNHG